MTMRKTPYLRLRYPWTTDVVDRGDIQIMAQDIDQALAQTQTMAANFSKFASVTVTRNATQSVAKNTLTTVTFDTVVLNNGANSPLANGVWWAAGAPTRLTAPVACVVLASALNGFNFGSSLGVSGVQQTTVALNGATGGTGVQGSKFSPISAASGQSWASALTMWKLNAGDFLELKVFWNGTPAGPFSTDNVIPPTLSLMMVALPTVP